MAFQNLFYQTQTWGVESEVNSPILDDHILDGNGFESSLDMSRRESFVDSGIYSPQSRDWIDTVDYDQDMADNQHQAMPVSFEHSNGTNNPFVKLEAQNFGQQNAWGSRSGMSGAATPTIYEAPVAFAAFDGTPYMPQPFAPVPAAAMPNSSAFDASMFSPQPSSLAPSAITSPVQEHQWALPSEKQQTQQPTPTSSNQNSPNAMKRTRPNSPAPRTHSPLNIRRDGIRKKNARFEIPAERTLLTIDHLIAQSADDQEIKELKQQKRLLRNRQAALDSRQRKKQHTERLEEEKKIHSTIISDLEEKLSILQMRDHEWKMRNDQAMKELENCRHQVEVLQMEKEDMVKKHTIETGELRKKNNYLVDQCSKLENALQNRAAPGSASYGDEFDDLDDLENGNFFDAPTGYDNGFNMRMDPPVKKERMEEDKAAPAPGLLLILLLCGAFVASSKVASKALPPLPQPIRNASAGILQTIFNDAGVQQHNNGRVMASLESSTTDWLSVRNDGGSKMVGIGSSTLEALNAQLNSPSAQQERAELAQLTADEYNSVTSKEFREPESISIKGRRQIEEGLASMRATKGSAAEVYTRSLLWDKVDAEVVRRFAAFAQQAQAAAAQANAEQGNHGMSV
ncbi:hypothetical protein BJ508DRAFT_325385 [Ascobolus immersus RN42]|uniref:BZIP domain-containing protein n=1 Tax=Ascobolus immersus RN42 TaxID=1160509 RepID=A0A3N4I985_ASCIM|nr:hypothetical protein BJ508DRAFT_325385 [Ascobolus immersus RN42]